MKLLKAAFLSLMCVLPASAFSKNVAVVLMYHRIAEVENDMNTTPERFAQQMEYLHSNNYNVITGEELVSDIQNKKEVAPKTVVITFDDGWASQKSAMDILEKYKYPGMFALVTEYQQFKNKTYLQPEDFEKYKANNFTYVNHSHTHFIKDFIKRPDYDVALSKLQIMKSTGKFVPIYVYPYGKRSKALVKALKNNGYIAAFGVYGAPVDVLKVDIFNINRYMMNDKVDMDRFEKIVGVTLPNDKVS